MPWGFDTPTHGTANIGSVTAAVIAANANRKYLNVINDSDTAVYLRLGTANAVANEGVRLNANGGNFEMSQEKGNLWTGAIQGISSAANKKIIYLEGD